MNGHLIPFYNLWLLVLVPQCYSSSFDFRGTILTKVIMLSNQSKEDMYTKQTTKEKKKEWDERTLWLLKSHFPFNDIPSSSARVLSSNLFFYSCCSFYIHILLKLIILLKYGKLVQDH